MRTLTMAIQPHKQREAPLLLSRPGNVEWHNLVNDLERVEELWLQLQALRQLHMVAQAPLCTLWPRSHGE